MSIDYKQLQNLVREAMFTGGGINEPSAPEGVPHRMPASDSSDKQQDMGDPKANELYEVALVAREATEKLVEALDEPQYQGEHGEEGGGGLSHLVSPSPRPHTPSPDGSRSGRCRYR